MKRALVAFYEYAVYKTVGILNVVRWLEWPVIERWAAIRPGERVLDAACGRGSLTLRLARRAEVVYGFDISPRAIGRASRVAKRMGDNARFLIADAEHLPFGDGSFNTIVSSSALEHFGQGHLAIAEMARVLRAGGRLVLTTDHLTSLSPELRERHRRASSVAHYYTEDELLQVLQQYMEIRRQTYLINSPVSTFVYRLGIRLDWGGTIAKMLVWFPVSILAYPVCRLADYARGSPDRGYTFIVDAAKRL